MEVTFQKKKPDCHTVILDTKTVCVNWQVAIHATTPTSGGLPAEFLAKIPGFLGSLQGGTFHFKGCHFLGTIQTAILASWGHPEHATAVKFDVQLYSNLGTSLARTLTGGTAVSFPFTVEVNHHSVICEPCHRATRRKLLVGHSLVDKVRSIDTQGSDTFKATDCTGHSFATLAQVRAQRVLVLNQFCLGFWVKHGIAPISGVARALQDATVVGVCRNAQAISGLLGFWPRYKLGAVLDVTGAHTTVTISGINLHWGNVPHVGWFNQLSISIRISMERFARFTTVSFWKELGGWNGCIFPQGCRWFINGNPFRGSPMSHWISRCCCNSPQFRVLTSHKGHVMMIIGPVDGNWDVLLGIFSWMTNWLHHDLVHLISGDGHHFALKTFHDFFGQRLISLVGPKDLTVVGGNLWCPNIKEFVAFGGVVVIKLDVLHIKLSEMPREP